MNKTKVNKHIKNKYIDIFMIILFYISLFLLIYIIVDLITNINNINEYFLYKKIGLDRNKMCDFVKNATLLDKKIYFTYFTSLLEYPPLNLDYNNVAKIELMLQVKFISIYNWTAMCSIFTVDIVLFIICLTFLITKHFSNKKIKNFKRRSNRSSNAIKNVYNK